jgi:hypothetical protein
MIYFASLVRSCRSFSSNVSSIFLGPVGLSCSDYNLYRGDVNRKRPKHRLSWSVFLVFLNPCKITLSYVTTGLFHVPSTSLLSNVDTVYCCSLTASVRRIQLTHTPLGTAVWTSPLLGFEDPVSGSVHLENPFHSFRFVAHICQSNVERFMWGAKRIKKIWLSRFVVSLTCWYSGTITCDVATAEPQTATYQQLLKSADWSLELCDAKQIT